MVETHKESVQTSYGVQGLVNRAANYKINGIEVHVIFCMNMCSLMFFPFRSCPSKDTLHPPPGPSIQQSTVLYLVGCNPHVSRSGGLTASTVFALCGTV